MSGITFHCWEKFVSWDWYTKKLTILLVEMAFKTGLKGADQPEL